MTIPSPEPTEACRGCCWRVARPCRENAYKTLNGPHWRDPEFPVQRWRRTVFRESESRWPHAAGFWFFESVDLQRVFLATPPPLEPTPITAQDGFGCPVSHRAILAVLQAGRFKGYTGN